MSILRAAGLIAVISLISKFMGLAREMVIANYYGTTYIKDAYRLAALLPSAFALIMLAGLNGPFHSSIVSVISKYKAKNEHKDIKTVTFTIVILSTVFMTVITFLCMTFASEIINLLSSGKFPQETRDLAILQFKIMCPIFMLSGLIGISYGILNVEKVYLTPSLSPIMASISIIIALLISTPEQRPIALAWGTMIGAVLQLLLQMLPLFKRLKHYISFNFYPSHPGVKLVIAILLPAALSSTIGQINIFITTYFATGLPEGSIAALDYANLLMQLPLGILLTALLVPMLPILNESITYDDDNKSFKQNINKGMRSLLFVSVPATVILLLSGKQLIQIMLERGAFNNESTILTAKVLTFYSIGLIAYAIRDLLIRVFYALDNANIPFQTSFISIVLMGVFCWLFTDILNYKAEGIAFAVSLVTIFNMILLGILLVRKIGNWLEKETLNHLYKNILASLPLAIFCYFFNLIIANKLDIPKAIVFFIILGVLGLIYIYILRLLKDKETIIITDRIFSRIKRIK